MEEVVGRDGELTTIESFLELADNAPRILLLAGEAGIGKSTLWRSGVEAARERGYRVLSCTAARSESELSFIALRDLLENAFDDVADALPAPQRQALAVALLLEDPSRRPPDVGVLGIAFVSAVRELAASGPTVVAIDDVQWLDASSAAVIGFGLRRLGDAAVASLLARREGESWPLELTPEAFQTLSVEPLSIGALHRVVVDRFEMSYSRPALRRLHETSGGNPFYAIELARALQRRGVRLHPGEDFPFPSSLEQLVDERLSALSYEGRLTVAAAALLARPTVASVASIGRLDEALAAGVLEQITDGQLVFTHPLLSAAARGMLAPAEAREVHARLADRVGDPTERARHRALAADAPHEDVAGAAERAAEATAARGEHDTAVSLLELAIAVTPPDAVRSARRRQLGLAVSLVALGEATDAREVLEALTAELAPGGERSDALVVLAAIREDDFRCALELAEQALDEADTDVRRAAAHAALSALTLQVGEFTAAREHARIAARLETEPGHVARALAHVILLETLAGAPVADEVIQRAVELDEHLISDVTYPVPLSLGLRRMYEDRHDEARRLLLSAVEICEERGRMTFAPHLHLAELEVRAGSYEEAALYALEALDEAEQWGLEGSIAPSLYGVALVEAHSGREAQAREFAERAIAVAGGSSDWIFESQARAVLGFLELSLGRPTEAAAILEPLAKRLVDAGLGDPSVWVGALPNAVEALIAIGELERAQPLLATLQAQGAALVGPWTRARAARAAGLLADAEGRHEDAVTAFESALSEAEIPFERGRTLLAVGGLRRRMRQKRVARERLGEAKRIFDELGAELWAQQGRAELGRIGGRAASPTELTTNERRIAELVADGKTNKEVAALLVVTDRTIESALTQIYRKLDVRSRTELARKLTRA